MKQNSLNRWLLGFFTSKNFEKQVVFPYRSRSVWTLLFWSIAVRQCCSSLQCSWCLTRLVNYESNNAKPRDEQIHNPSLAQKYLSTFLGHFMLKKILKSSTVIVALASSRHPKRFHIFFFSLYCVYPMAMLTFMTLFPFKKVLGRNA